MAKIPRSTQIQLYKGKGKHCDAQSFSHNYETLISGEEKENMAQATTNGDKVTKEIKPNIAKLHILSGLQYRVDDNPPWISTILLGFQHYLMLLGSNLATPGMMASIICAVGNAHVNSILLGNMLFACGICTLLQTYIGARLPIVQCPAFAFIVPMIALSKTERWKCPETTHITGNITSETYNGTNTHAVDGEALYIERMNMLTGSIMVAAVLEIVIGASGIISVLMRFIGPMTVAPTIMLMGLSVAETGFEQAGKHWGIAVGTIILIVVLSECIPTFMMRNPFNRKGSWRIECVVHKIFSVIISVCIMWFVSFILTVSGALPDNPKSGYGYQARTDIRTNAIKDADWIRVPYPGYWGMPSFSSAMFVGMIAGVVTSIIESIGDYYTCARLAGALPPPPSAINRGIFIEGIDCILAAAVGAGFGVTSCSQNIGVISLTKVGSRRVLLVAGAFMTVFGCLGKFSALVVSMPDPIIGASFLVLFGVLAAVGVSNLQYVDLNSSRNLLCFGMSLFLGLSFPGWVAKNETLIRSGNDDIDQVITALLGNNMFMGCFSALILDNVIPGTADERGILLWRKTKTDEHDFEENSQLSLKTYDFPIGMKFIRKWRWTKYIPIMPTFIEIERERCCFKEEELNGENDNEMIEYPKRSTSGDNNTVVIDAMYGRSDEHMDKPTVHRDFTSL
ncbi:hypothetical protein ACJMK2_019355 [Sinanodonta woodiana]|uniref:Solute carrier family 23 member 2 n=1 Tax=Sinanodonta woodiana TaxID=1069815 RepID=A0ABD3UJ83_SINWO